MNTFYLNITASDKVFYADHCKALVIPLADGEKEVLPHHENMIIAISLSLIHIFVPIPFSFYFDIFDGLIRAYVFVFLTALFIKEALED